VAARLVVMRNLIILPVLVVVASGCGRVGPVLAGGELDEVEEVTSAPLSDPTTSTSAPLSDPTTSTSAPAGPSTDRGVEASAETPAPDSDRVTEPPPEFEWAVTVIDESNRAEVASTWRPECPVTLEDLRLIEVAHRDFEGGVSKGRLVIRHDLVEPVVTVMQRLFEAGFPMERMEPIDVYDGSDQASMAANNTSAFNCREISGSPGVWSQHAYGGAIDVNPLVNPWVQGARVDPPEGEIYTDRDLDVPGLIRTGDVVTLAFAEVGWGWGGDWADSKDYQHFSWNGR
jgi:hypothetical protein